MILRPCLLKFAFSLVVLTLLITNQSLSQPIKTPPFKNIIVHPKPKNIIGEEYKDQNGKKIKFIKFEKQLTIINFWATWCAPCREEMPSIDKLVDILGKEKISVIAINTEKINLKKTNEFFNDLKIKNFKTFFDPDYDLANKIGLRGLPTTLIINSKGLEVARVMGSIDFSDQKFISWISSL